MPTLRPHSLTEIYDLLYEKHEGDIDRLNAETQKIKVKYITRSKLQARDGNINWDDRSGRYEIHEIIDTDITHVNIFDEPMTNMYMVIMSVMMMVQDLGDDIIVFYEDDLKYIKSKGIEGTNVSDFGITLSEQAAIENLNNKLSEKDAEIEAKERQMAELMERIAELEKKK